MKKTIILLLLVALAGCNNTPDNGSAVRIGHDQTIDWVAKFDNVESRVDRLQGNVDSMQNTLNAMRPSNSSMVASSRQKSGRRTYASYQSPDVGSLTDEVVQAASNSPAPGPDPQMQSVVEAVNNMASAMRSMEETQSRESAPVASQPTAPAQSGYSAAPPTYSSQAYSAAPYSSAPVYSTPQQTYSQADGPVTYGAARQTGTKEVIEYRTVQKVVTEKVPVKRQVPMMSRPVFKTIQEQVPVQVQKVRMRTEQRTKKVAKTVYVDEPYSVSVPETVTETVMQTRSRRVQVGDEQVPVPVAPVSYSSAPSPVNCPVPVQTPVYSAPAPAAPVYSAPAPVYSAPAPTRAPVYSAPAPVYSAPIQQIIESAPAPMQPFAQAVAPVAQAVYSAAAPIVSYSSQPQTYSTASSGPCNDPNCPNCKPKSFSSARPVASGKPAVAPTRLQQFRASRAASQSYSSSAASSRPTLFSRVRDTIAAPVQGVMRASQPRVSTGSGIFAGVVCEG